MFYYFCLLFQTHTHTIIAKHPVILVCRSHFVSFFFLCFSFLFFLNIYFRFFSFSLSLGFACFFVYFDKQILYLRCELNLLIFCRNLNLWHGIIENCWVFKQHFGNTCIKTINHKNQLNY